MKKTFLPLDIVELEESSFHVFIQVVFPNHKSGDLVIDTGASKTVFDKEFVEDFIVHYIENNEEITSSGINNPIHDIEFVVLKQIQLEDLIIKNFETAIMDLGHINHIYQKYGKKHIAGLIGSDFLFQYNAEISYKKKQLMLEFEP